jgi:TrpR-related protein YerC/YecD
LDMIAKKQDDSLQFLYRVILLLQTQEECERFFDDLCTGPELKALAQRLEVAKLLKEQNVYSKIVEKTGASTATISRVNRSLQYGANGYDIVFERLEQQDGKL